MVISKEGGISANWESSHVLLFCDLCIREIDLGNRPTTHFNEEGWVNLMKNFNERTGLEYSGAHMKNKWDQLKRDWKLWRELKRGETGLGWNPTKRTIDASDDWWKERIEMIPNAKKFRSAGIPPDLEEKLEKMFNLVVATGDNVWIPSSRELPSIFSQHDALSRDDDHTIEQNNTQVFANDDIGSATPGQSSQSGVASKRKRKGKKLDMRRVAAPIVPPSIYLLREAIQELEKYPEIFEDRQLYHFATVHFQTPVKRVTFLSIPEDRRVEWLKTHYMNSLN